MNIVIYVKERKRHRARERILFAFCSDYDLGLISSGFRNKEYYSSQI